MAKNKHEKDVAKAVKWAEDQQSKPSMTHEMVTDGESEAYFTNDPAKMGRPTKYKVEFNQVVKSMSMRGAVDLDLCEALDISEPTLTTWKAEYPDFLGSIKEGKDLIDTMVEKSLLNRAIGCNIKEIKVHCDKDGGIHQTPIERHFPPDPTSMIFWLKNRKPKEWRDKHEVDFVSPLTIRMDDADQGTL